MKLLKIAGVAFISFTIILIAIFFLYTSFVDKLDISYPEKSNFIHPSKLLIKYEVFISGIVLRPSYKSFVNKLNLSGNESILDFGSGAGGEAIHIAKFIQNKNGKLTCMDISHSWLEVVKYRLSDYKNIDTIEGDITKLNITQNSFDVIVLRLVLHDIPNEQRKSVIKIFYNILKKNGIIYIYEPITTNHSINETEMRSLFKNAHFYEKYFKHNFSFVMIPPRTMGEAVYVKN